MLTQIKKFYSRRVDTKRRGGEAVLKLAFALAMLPAVFFSPTIQARGATIEIAVSQLDQEPVLFFLQAKNGMVNKTLSPNATQAQIISSMLQFDPPLQVLPVGTRIEVLNRDPVLHNTHVFKGSLTLFNVATPNAEIAVQRTLSRAGLFGVRCDLHPSMNAWIVVVSNPYYTIIKNPGVYRIENIKPGRYEARIQRPERPDQILEMELVAAEERKIQLPP
jgi:plastocyanin